METCLATRVIHEGPGLVGQVHLPPCQTPHIQGLPSAYNMSVASKLYLRPSETGELALLRQDFAISRFDTVPWTRSC